MSNAPIPGGYILVSRKLLESDVWDRPPLYLKIWMYLLLKAQHRDYKGLKRGQVWTSIPEIQEAMAYKVGYRVEKPTRKQIWGALEFLRTPPNDFHVNSHANETMNEPMIETTKGTHGLLVTIVNYDVYQDPKKYERNSERDNEEPTKEQRRQRQGNNINKNDKNDKKYYGEFVRLTDEEHQKLTERLGQALTADYIERLNNYIGSKGTKYKSHYHTILTWVRNDEKKQAEPPTRKRQLYMPEGEE